MSEVERNYGVLGYIKGDLYGREEKNTLLGQDKLARQNSGRIFLTSLRCHS